MRLPILPALLALLLVAVLPAVPPARAADEPEVVYTKFHRAVMAGELDEMLKYGPASRRAELQGMSASTREAALRMAKFMMPRAFTLQRKTVLSNGRGATLIVAGPWSEEGQPLRTMYGTVQLVMENGEWKVDESNWSNERPAILATPAPKPAAAADKTAAKAQALTGKGAPAVGTMDSAIPSRPLGVAKEPCVYKPVMTAKDMENCK